MPCEMNEAVKRTVIFISHATPEDNYFAAWLASKLKVLGYDAWVDLNDLNKGDSFYTVIQPIIENRAAKFIAVNTNDYVRKAQNQHSGVSRELNCAISITDLTNFIIPIKVDETDYNKFPMHYKGWDAIDFYGNWQTGLIELERELSKAGLPKKINFDNPINLWFESIKVQNTVLEKKESYYSNWFDVHFPNKLYIHQTVNTSKKQTHALPYPFVMEANRIITFAHQEQISNVIPISRSWEFFSKQLLSEHDLKVDDEYTLKEPRKKLVWLLNNCFEGHLRKQNLIFWDRGKEAKRKMFYFRYFDTRVPVNLARYGKKGHRKLTGRTTETINKINQKVHWHFAISASADLHPKPHYKIFYSVVFTDNNFIRFSKEVHHSLRRSVPSEWYNRKWFETLLAAMLKISPSLDDNQIQIDVGGNESLEVANKPYTGISKKGYIEPDNVE